MLSSLAGITSFECRLREKGVSFGPLDVTAGVIILCEPIRDVARHDSRDRNVLPFFLMQMLAHFSRERGKVMCPFLQLWP